MQSKLDLARKRADLVDQEGHNARREAEEKAAADAIEVEAEVRRIVEKGKAYEADWNTAGRARIANDAAYIQALAEAGPEVARALALKEMAKNMPSFGNITITADVLSDLVAAFTGSAKAGQVVMRRRAVIVRRPTEFDELMDRYSTRGQVEFVLRSRGRTLESVERAHESHVAALARVRAGIPDGWASADVERDSLSRFLFAPEDVIVVVGPDGLVANVAKYAGDQTVVGVNSVPQSNAGVLVRCTPDQGVAALGRIEADADLRVDQLTMVRATADDSRTLTALNEVFVGHPSHQSAATSWPWGPPSSGSPPRARVSTGTRATGWGASLKRGRRMGGPARSDLALARVVRARGMALALHRCRIHRGDPRRGRRPRPRRCLPNPLVLFGDGMESDRLTLTWGQSVRISRAPRALSLVDPAGLGEG